MHDGIAVGRVVRIGVLGLLALVLVVASAVLLSSHWDNPRPPATSTPPEAWVRGPLLETEPQVDMEAYLARKRKALEGYAWVDRAHGIARIPLDMAMRAVEQGVRP